MKYYNSKSFFKILFSLRSSDTMKTLAPSLLGITLYAIGVYYIEVEYLKLTENSSIKNVNMLHSLLGFVLSMLLVFRTNTAYDRWWEGRKLWGKLVNDSRNLAIKLNAILPVDNVEERRYFRRRIVFFAHSLSRHLSKKSTEMALDSDYSKIEQSLSVHGPMELANKMTARVYKLRKEGLISNEELIYIDAQLSGFLEVCGGCERIKNTPIPYSYSSFVKKFIMIYCLALPIANVVQIGWMIIPLTIFVFYVLMSLEVIAEEIEDPFNNDENDLPTEHIAQNIERNVTFILGEG